MDWLQIIATGLSGGTLITAFLIVRRISRLEFQVETMWKAFEHRYGSGFLQEVRKQHSNRNQ